MVSGILLAKGGGVLVNALPEGRAAGLTGLIELERLHGGEYRKAAEVRVVAPVGLRQRVMERLQAGVAR